MYDKLAEEHAELLAAGSAKERCEELADMIEVILALAGQYGCGENELQRLSAKSELRAAASRKGCTAREIASLIYFGKPLFFLCEAAAFSPIRKFRARLSEGAYLRAF